MSSHAHTDIYAETLTVFKQTTHPNEPLTSPEVADALDCPRRTVYKRLETLADRGALRTKKVGSSARVWWRPRATLIGPPAPSIVDRSEQQWLEDDPQTTHLRYERLVEQNLVGVCIIQDGVVKYVNPTFTDILGYTQDEAIGQPVLDFVAEEERDLVAEHVRQREHGEIDVIRYEGRGKHADGTVVDVEIYGDLIEYEGESAILGTLVDMSERKERERKLEKSERRYRTLAEHFPNGVVALFDHDLRYTLVAGSVPDETDFSPKNLEGRWVGETASNARKRLEGHCRATLTGEKRTFEFEWGDRDLQAQTLPVEDETGSVFAGMMMTQDITERKERERELEDYRTVVENVRDGVYMTDADRRFTMVNEAYCELTGCSREELLGAPASKVVDNKEISYSAELIRELREGKREVAVTEAYHYTSDGERIPVENRFTIRSDDNAFHGTIGVVRDMTDRLERERELREQRNQYRRLIEYSPAPIVIYTADGSITYLNDAATDRFAIDTADDIIGKSTVDFVHPDDRPKAVERMRRIIEEREAIPPKEMKVIDENGRIKHTILTGIPVVHEGQPAAQVVINDITERKEAEQALQESERRLRALVDASSEVMYHMSPDWSELRELGGGGFVVDTDSPRDDWLDEYIHPDDQKMVWDVIQETIETKSVFDLEHRVRRTDGTLGWTHSRAVPVLDDDGEITEWFGVATDITERKQRERQLEQYERIVETVNDGVYVVDDEKRFTMVNEAYAKMMGYDCEELLGEHVSLVADETVITTAEGVEREMQRGKDGLKVEANLQRADGGSITAEATFSLLPDDDSHERVGVVRDITERKERELELKQYKTIFETIDDGVYIVDDNRRFTMVNEGYAEMVGYDREELLGEHVSMVVSESTAATAGEIEQAMKGGERNRPKVEAELHRADGGSITAEATFSLLPGDDTNKRVGVVRDISERKEQEYQLEQQRQELAALNHLQAVALNVSDLVLEQSTRNEMEQGVCERLAASNVYDFAWIGHTNRSGQEITVHAASELSEQLAETPVSLDIDDSTQSPITQSLNTHSLQLSRTTPGDPVYERWCEESGSKDHSMIAVPVAYEGRCYGVLTLYTKRSSIVGEIEKVIIRQLAEIVGHAVTAIERGKSLLADRGIEVEYRSKALTEPFISKADGDLDLSIDRAIPVGDDGFLYYYKIEGISADQCIELGEELPAVTNIRVLFEEDDYVRVEMRTTGETVASTFAMFDGRIKITEITDGELRVVGELPETVNIRAVTEAVKETYPDMEFAGQQYVTRQQLPPKEFRTVIEDSLTERQRTVLEAACYSGFFDWPRESSGGDVADSLDISSSTFHQHLRKAEKKLLDVVFANS